MFGTLSRARARAGRWIRRSAVARRVAGAALAASTVFAGVVPALPPPGAPGGSVARAQTAAVIIEPLSVRFYSNSSTGEAVSFGKNDTPLFTQDFPAALSFNPPGHSQGVDGDMDFECPAGTPLGHPNDEHHRPWALFKRETDGTCSVHNAGNGSSFQPGVDPPAGPSAFQAGIRSWVQIGGAAGQPVSVDFRMRSDDGFIIGFGRKDGAATGTFPSNPNGPGGTTILDEYPAMARSDASQFASGGQTFTVQFPEPGRYPVEIDYANCCNEPFPQGALTLVLTANGTYLVPGSPPAATATPTSTSTHTPTATATPAPPIESPPTDTLYNPPFINAGTSAGGAHTFTGRFHTAEVDVAIAGRGPSPVLARTYNGGDPRAGALGSNWIHSYEMRVTRAGDGSGDVFLTGPMGRVDRYPPSGGGGGALAPPEGVLGAVDSQSSSAGRAPGAADGPAWLDALFGDAGPRGLFERITRFFAPRGALAAPSAQASTVDYTPPPGVHTKLRRNADYTFTATHKDQTTWRFNATGRLHQIKDRYGNESTLAYDGAGRLSSVSDPAGRSASGLTFTHDPGTGRLTKVSDWLSPAREVQYQYDAQGRLWKVTDREGAVTEYGYDGTSTRLTTIKDPLGNVQVTNTYDAAGRVETQKDARGPSTGQQTAYAYTANADGTRRTDVTYPQTSFAPTWNSAARDDYDARGWLTRRELKPTAAETLVEQAAYDAIGNLVSVSDPRGGTTTFCYDTALDGVTPLNTRGNLTRRIDPQDVNGIRPTTLFRYSTDQKDNLELVVPPNGVPSGATTGCSENFSGAATSAHRTELAYDATGVRLVAVTQRHTDPDAGLQTATTKYEYTDSSNPGRITRAIPPRGNTSATPDASYATTFSWFGSGARAGMLDRVTDPLGNITTFDYDAVGRRTSAVGPLGNVSGANPAHFSSTTTYDREDRPRVTSAPAPNAGGAAITAENRYDAAGNRTVAIDPLGQVTRYLYDERNQLSEVRQSPSAWTDPNAEPGDRIATTYDYDHLAALKRVTRAQGDAASERVTDYENDGLGRTRRELQYPAWPSTSGALVNAATYDGNGNRATLTQPDGLTTTFAHDALNRLTGVTYADGQTPSVSYAYDKNGNRTQMVDGQGTTTYAYDERDAMLSTTSPLPGCGAGSVIGYRYDLDGNRTKVVYPPSSGCGASADAVTYLFDKASRLESLVGWDNRKTAYDYFPDGALKGATFSIANVDKTRSDYAYDNARRLTQVDNRFVGNGLNEVDAITSHAYGVDAAGNRTAVQERAARVGSFAPNPAAAPDPLMKEPPGGVGGPATSLALDGAGRPVIAYVDQTTFQLRVLRCGGADCGPAGAGDPLNVQLLDGAAEPAGATFAVSLALDQQNRPIVAFPGLSGTGQNAVVVIRCGDAECGTHTREVIEEGSDFGYDHVSLVLDGAGRPAISYQNREAWQLKVARCGDAQCTPATTTVSAPIPTGDGHSGYHSAIAIGADNLPIVAHNDARALRVVRCANATCSSAASHAAPEPVTNDAFSGRDNSIRLDAAGNPVIAYARSGEGTNPSSVRVLHCTNAGCTGAQAPATLDANPGGWTSLRLDARGFPVVSFFDATGADLELARCNDAACATAAVVRASPDTAGGVGKGTSLALDAAGYPVISYFDETNGDLRVLRCNSASCGGAPNVLPTPTVAPTATPAAGTVAVPDWNGDVGRFTSIALDAQGNPVVGYLDVTNGALKVLDCASPGCGPGSASLAADSGVAGVLNGSLEIDGQGRPVVAYLGAAGLTILRCGDASCASGNTITATGITGAGELSLALDGQDRPVVAFNERTQLDLALMRCGDATCTTHSLTRPDTATDTGWSPSLRLDAADRPVILFHQGFNFGAALLHCADPTCSAGGSHSLRAIQINEQASHTALALTADGGVAMAYRTASGLTFVRCDDLDCTGTLTPRVLDTGPATWIAIAADSTSRATISYAVADAGGSFDLKLVRCGNTACAVGNTTTVADSAGSVGEYTSIALDASGYPIVSYYDRTNGDLKVLRCANPTCAGGNPPQATPTIVPTPTQTPSSTPTATPTPTTTPSPTETLTPSTTPTASSTPTASNTPTITPSPTPTVPPNRIIVADAGELVGQYSSLALDASGVPAVSYFGANYLQLLFFRCADASCPATGNTQRALDQSGNAGTHSSIAIDAAGNPVISYRDDLSDTLKVLRCGDATCSAGNTTATPDAAGDVGQFTSIALNAAGNAVVSYYAGAGGELKLLVCGNAACTSGNSVAVIDPGVANDGQSTSLALDAAGNPVVSYYSPSNGDLKVITCGDATCSSGNTIAFPDRTGDVGGGTSLRIGATGKPVVAYSDTTTLRLKLLLCGDATCTRGNTIRHLDALGGHPSLALDSQGRPVVSYQDAANGDVKVLRCGDAACSSGNTVAAADGPAVVGSYTSLELDQSDRPVVSYHDGTNGDLKLLLCGTPTCAGTPLGAPAPVPTSTPQPTPTAAQPWITTVDWEGSVGSHTSVRLNAGKPVVAYRDETYQDLKLLVCGDATCRSGNVVRELDTGRNVGQHASLALDAGGAPVVAYYDVLGQDLKLARCADPACDALPAVTAPDTAGNVGQYASVQVDAAGRPVVAYAAQSGSSYSLKLLRCGDTTCSAGNSITTVDGASSVGWYASLVLDAAGNPVIAYMDVAAADLKLAVCADATCSAGTTIRTLEQTGSVGHYARLVLDASGRPAVAHASFGGGVSYRPRVVRCGDATCSAGNTVTALDFDGAGGEFLGFAVRSDDKPVLAYSSYWFQRLRLAFCADPACAAGTVFLMPEPESLSQTWSSLALDEADAPAVSYYGAALDLKVLRCVEATCDGSAPPLTTSTPTPTATPTSTPTATPTATPVPTVTPTPTPGPTSTNTVAPTPTNAPNRIVVAESANDVGQHTSLVLDSAGLPVVAHQSVTSSQPRFFKCANLACTTGNISRSLDGGTFGGTYTSIALDSSGRPVISYRDDNSRDLRVIRCGDATCSAGNSLAIPDGPNDVGQYTSLVLNAAGNPVISYHAFDLGDLKILTCGNATCTSGNTVASPDTETNVGQWTSLALNAAGNPVVSYYGVSNGDVRVLTCGNATCTSGNTVAVLDKTGGATGQYTSLALDAQGRPVVSYADANYDLRIARCGDATCSQPQANTITVADASGSTGLYTSLALDGQGRPVVSYYDSTGQDLKVLRCGDATCSSGNTIATPDAAGVVGWWTALALDANGFPVISYYDYTNGNLKLLFCGSATCLGSSAAVYVTPTATAVPAPAALAPWIVLADREDVVGSHTSLKLNAGKPVVAYRDETYRDLKLLVCGVNTCASGNLIRTLDTVPDVGQFASLALDASAYPVVSYYDAGAQDLRIARCGDATCLAPPTITVPDSSGNVGQYTSLQLDASGFPVVAYAAQSGSTYSLKLLRCGDATCASGNTITTVSTTGSVGAYASLRLNASGFPVIAFYDATNLDLRVVTCGNATCSSGNTFATVDSAGNVGEYASLRLDSQGRPVIAYVVTTGGRNAKIARCGNATCTSGNTIRQVDFGFNTGPYVSLALRGDDRPVLGYFNGDYGAGLKLYFCGDATCSAGNAQLGADAGGGNYVSLELDANGVPAISHYDNTDLRVVRCKTNNACVQSGGGLQSLGGAILLETPTPTATATATETPTATVTGTPPTSTPSATPTPSPEATATPTVAPTETPRGRGRQDDTATPTTTATATATATVTPAATATSTASSTSTATASTTATATATMGAGTATAAATSTATTAATSTPVGGVGGSGFAPDGGPEVAGVQAQALPCASGPAAVSTPIGVSPATDARYEHDRLSRLTCAAGPWVSSGTTYSYDPVGNRLSMVRDAATTAYGYDRADRIQVAGTTAYTVNSRGNLLARGGDAFAYDQANRLTAATVGGNTSTYAYSGDGLRVAQTAGGNTTRYTWDVNRSLPVALVEGTTRHVWGAGGLAWSVLEDDSTRLYHTDGLGSVRAVTDGQGVVQNTYRTDEFGVPDPSGTSGLIGQAFQFTGEPRDASGLVYLRARHLDPTSGRFVTRDPLAGLAVAPSSLNRYVYVGNNPTTLTDPSGLASRDVWEWIKEQIEKGCLDPDSHLFCWYPGSRPTAPGQPAIIHPAGLRDFDFAGIADDLTRASRRAASKASSAGAIVLEGVGGGRLRRTISISEARLHHAIDGHTIYGSKPWLPGKDKSVFGSQENLIDLVQAASSYGAVKQSTGNNFETIVDAGRTIGIDRDTGQWTSIYTVITDASDNLITMFPGRP